MTYEPGNDVPLFARQQAKCELIAFPLDRRLGKIRDVAEKMLAKSTDRHAEHYRRQVTDALMRHLARFGLPSEEQDAQLAQFWLLVQAEIIRTVDAGGSHPKGAA